MSIYLTDQALVGAWLQDNNTRDLSQRLNHLTNQNGMTFVTDRKRGRYSGDFEASSSQYLFITDADQNGLDITGNISVFLWFKPETLVNYIYLVSKYLSTGDQRSFAANAYANGTTGFVLSPDGTYGARGVAVTPTGALSNGTWAHIGCVYNGTDMRVYIDGSLASNGSDNPYTYSGGIHSGSAPFRISSYAPSIYYADGLINEVLIFNDAKSAEDVYSLYNEGILFGTKHRGRDRGAVPRRFLQSGYREDVSQRN